MIIAKLKDIKLTPKLFWAGEGQMMFRQCLGGKVKIRQRSGEGQVKVR